MIPTNVDEHIRELFTLWREHPDYDGGCFVPRAEFYVDGEMEAIIMFPPDDDHPLARSLYDVSGILAPLGDGVVVVCETWVRMVKGETTEAAIDVAYRHGDLALDPASEQALVIMKITADTLALELLPFGVDDDGTVTWGEKAPLDAEFGGHMVDVINEARDNGAPLHEKLNAMVTQFDAVMDRFEGETLGKGAIYRGALSALGKSGRYLMAMSESLRDMP